MGNMNKYEVVISALFILASIRYFRIYFRTKQTGILLLTVGCLVLSMGLILDVYDFHYSIHLMVIGYIFFNVGLILQGTSESGTRKYIINNTTFFQRLVGEVPIIRGNIKPQVSKIMNIILGGVTLGLGTACILLYKNVVPFAISFLVIIFGILIIVATIIWGRKTDAGEKVS